MGVFVRSSLAAAVIAAAIQCFTVGVLSPKFSLELCRPGAERLAQLHFEDAEAVELSNADGAVHVATHEGRGLDVTAQIRAYTASSDTQPLAEEYVKRLVEAQQTGGKVSIVTEPHDRPDGVDLRVDYRLKVPQGTAITVDGSSGNVYIGEGCGAVSVDGNNTDIDIQYPTGTVQATTANGRIDVAGASQETHLETVNGSIYVNMLSGSLRASTANGNIVAGLEESALEICDLTAMNGGITLVAPPSCSAEVYAMTGEGSITSDLPVNTLDGVNKRHELRGALGDGRMQLTMNSLNGNIWIKRKEL